MFHLKVFVGCTLIAALTGLVASTANADEQAKGGRNRDDLIKKFDTNGDGKLDEQEKEAAKKEFQGKRGAGNRAGGMAELIKKFDKNGDGKLDDQEREAAHKEMKGGRKPGATKPTDGKPGAGKPGAGKSGNLESNEKLLKHFDKNGDGKLDDDERAAAKAEMEKRRADKGK